MHTLTHTVTKTAVLSMTLLAALVVNYLFAWDGPTTPAPPDPASTNVPAPINTGADEQTKVGNLNIDGGLVASGGLSAPALVSTGKIYSDGLGYHFGSSGQVLSSDGGSKGRLYWHSGNATQTQMVFNDGGDNIFGKIYGDQNGGRFGLTDGDGNWSYKATKDVSTQFLVNNDAKVTILSDGKVGIGTDAPQTKLHVEGDLELKNSTPSIKFNDIDSGERH